MMICIWTRSYFRKHLEETWNFHKLGTQSVSPHCLQNKECLQKSCSITYILYLAPGIWIEGELCSFMIWFLMKRLTFVLISFIFCAKLFFELSQGHAFLFYCLISSVLKLKGVHPSADESPYPKPSPINNCTLNASIDHSRKGIKTETLASHNGSRSSSSSYDGKLDNIMASVHNIGTKMSRLATLLHHHNICCDTKFTSLQTQLDQIQRNLEENEN